MNEACISVRELMIRNLECHIPDMGFYLRMFWGPEETSRLIVDQIKNSNKLLAALRSGGTEPSLSVGGDVA
jgi:hypothetical protein